MNELRKAYSNIFNTLKNEWKHQVQYIHPAHRRNALCMFIEQESPRIKKLGELHRELGLDDK